MCDVYEPDIKFGVGDVVDKVAGGYKFRSEVRSVFRNKAGQVRLVCESYEIPGLLHIFNQEQMRNVE